MESFYYHGVWRMDWGLGNPNKTAALIAMLMMACWGLTYIHKYGFWISLALFTALGIGLIHTYSRGGLLALFVGLIPIMIFAPKEHLWKRFAGLFAAVGLLFAYSINIDAHDRYRQGFETEDHSITNRLHIWEAAPRMMVDAPWGWGLGNSGSAYMEWYQPVSKTEKYRTLVNSHLTWLVEMSWPLRFLYITAWLGVLTVCWPTSKTKVSSIPLGIWLAFGTAAFFSSVEESVWLWPLPIASIIFATHLRFKHHLSPSCGLLRVAVPAAVSSLLLIFALGQFGTHLKKCSYGVVLGRDQPRTWIVVDKEIMGSNYGHALRAYLDSGLTKETVGVIENAKLTVVPADATIVAAGASYFQSDMKNKVVKRIILLNPFFFPNQMDCRTNSKNDTEVYFGEYCQSPSVFSWTDTAMVHPLSGVGSYLPGWAGLALSSPSSTR